ncbi:TIGR01459 family HAD-type hydrolase [Pelagibacterales bacterium SAG-MED13]|nr:TIGR01459 family HAD-type hydrolase [Pelagibacterales bacterium SAG-MED13]
MTKNLDKEGLSSIVDNYQLFYVDLWGVVHNGVSLHQEAIKALDEITKKKKNYILLTNAPRPNHSVKSFLEKLGLKKEIRDHVFTSGEAALNYLKKNLSDKTFFHVGPPRDFDLFKELKSLQTERLDRSDYILCTGLFDDHDNDLKYYKGLFEKNLHKKMICTNPDLIVDRGNKRELCAGSVAMIFEKMGGKVIYFGKPYPEVYNQSINNKNKKILSIGDNLNTDIKGANLLNFDSLIISNGIHKNEIKEKGIEETSKSYEAICNYIQSELKW